MRKKKYIILYYLFLLIYNPSFMGKKISLCSNYSNTTIWSYVNVVNWSWFLMYQLGVGSYTSFFVLSTLGRFWYYNWRLWCMHDCATFVSTLIIRRMIKYTTLVEIWMVCKVRIPLRVHSIIEKRLHILDLE